MHDQARRPGNGQLCQLLPVTEAVNPLEDGDQPFMERIHGTRYYG
jgi:hypothetical protein